MHNLTHLEFIGPPGSGKSTIRSKLMSKYEIYDCGYCKSSLVRKIANELEINNTNIINIIASLVRPLPDNRLIRSLVRDKLFRKFASNNEKYLECMGSCISETKFQKDTIFYYFKRAGARYQLAQETLPPGKIFCADELFMMLAASVSWRAQNYEVPPNSFYEAIPLPEIIVFVNCPDDIALERQKSRGRISVDVDWVKNHKKAQQEWRRICETIRDNANKRGVKIIQVESTQSVSEIVSIIHNNIKKNRHW